MKAVVVYESLWGNTASIARAIAEGIGPEARALTTSQASGEAIAKGLRRAGYRRIAKDQRFIVKGTYGPLRDGELERAKAWGAELARLGKAG